MKDDMNFAVPIIPEDVDYNVYLVYEALHIDIIMLRTYSNFQYNIDAVFDANGDKFKRVTL